MKILFDQGTPAPLRDHLANHSVNTVYEIGWASLENSELLKAAENAGYDLLVTTDQNLKYQQNLRGRKLAILVLLSTSWPRLRSCVQEIARAVETLQAGDYKEFSRDKSAPTAVRKCVLFSPRCRPCRPPQGNAVSVHGAPAQSQISQT